MGIRDDLQGTTAETLLRFNRRRRRRPTAPQETRYTTLYFDPTAIAQYSATLEAVVEGGTDARTKSFTCEIRGEGTIPSLTLTVSPNPSHAGRDDLGATARRPEREEANKSAFAEA